MKQYRITTLILGVIVAIGACLFAGQRGDVHFKSYEYTPEDWVTTSHTLFSTDLSNDQFRDKYNYTWLPLKSGIQLRPILRYRSDYAVVELPDGRRGLVAPSTLSGLARSERNFVKYMSAKEYKAKNNISTNWEDPNAYELPYLVFKNGSDYTSVQANDLWADFTAGIPEYYYDYNDTFKVYVSAKKLESMSQEQIDSKYGEPISISYLDDGGKRAFYSHFRTDEGYNFEGTFVNYNADGTTTVEDPRDNDNNEYNVNYIEHKSRPILSRISSIDWVDLPLAFPLVSMFHLNFGDITNYPSPEDEESSFPYFWVFLASLVLTVVFVIFIAYLVMTICYPMKTLSNNDINYITFFVSVLPIMAIGTLYIELFQGLWIVMAIATLILVVIPVGLVSSESEFNRCDFCRNIDCVSHTKKLIDTEVTTRVDTYDYDDTSVDYKWNGDKKSETVMHKSDYETIETTTKKFLYNFHCSHCTKDWESTKSESKDRKIGERTVSHGGTKTTYK